MSDLWNKLHANSKAHEKYTNLTQFKIVGKHTGHIQPYLLEKLSEKTCTIARLVENCPHQRTRACKKKAIKMGAIALPTISEDHTVIPRLPIMPRLSEKGKLEPWIKESLQVYEMFNASDLVDASIKPRIEKVRQRLWSSCKTKKGVGMVKKQGLGGREGIKL